MRDLASINAEVSKTIADRFAAVMEKTASLLDSGLTYDRASVEVAVKITSPDDAIDEEARLIRRFRPRDNLIGQADFEETPF